MKSHEREPKIGRWFTFCCHLDLDEITDEQTVSDILFDRTLCHVQVWDTEQDALEELLECAEPGSEEETEIKDRLLTDYGWSCLDPDHNHATKAEADACTANTDYTVRK